MNLGLYKLGTTLSAALPVRNASRVPKDPSVAPNYRVYGPSGLVANATGSLSKLDTGDVTGATNASPIVITSASHGLQTGNAVVVASVGGNTAANGDFTVTRVNANTFSLDGSTGNGPYTSGGNWHVAGLYRASISLASGDGYEQGKTYTLLVTYTISGTTYTDSYTFTVT